MKGWSVVNKLMCLLLTGTLLVTTSNPVFSLTIGEERRIGQQLLYSVRGQFPVIDAPDIHQYINNLGQSVLDQVGPQYFDYHFFVVQSSQFNAFAAPAGLVFFYTGLIETMKTEDELLSVLAHEIGHVVSRHIAQRLDKSSKISAVSMAVALASLALGVPALSQGLFTGSMAAGQAATLQYSRNDEEQADRLSFGWMQEMGRNPKAMEGMLRTMRRITRYRSGMVPQYLLTHPNPEARLDYVQSLVELDDKQKDPDYYRKADNFAFLRFKYRILQLTMEPEKLRVFFANTLASAKEDEQRVMAEYGLALLEADENNPERAMQLLKKVKGVYPDRYILDIDEAVLLAENHQYKQAKTLLEATLARHPDDVYAIYELAKTEYNLGNLQRAEVLFTQAAGELSENAQIYYDLGKVSAGQGKNQVSRFYLGKYYLYKGKFKVAKRYFEIASKQKELPEELRNEALELLDTLKKIEKNK